MCGWRGRWAGGETDETKTKGMSSQKPYLDPFIKPPPSFLDAGKNPDLPTWDLPKTPDQICVAG